MKLNPDIDMIRFIQAVQSCRSDVYFVTQQDDRLNLKSMLSQIVFSVLQKQDEILEQGEVRCACPEDVELLRMYLCEEGL